MNDLTTIFAHYRVPYRGSEHHHVRTGWVGVDCPLCSPGWHRYRLGFELATGRVNCWSCGLQSGPAMLARLCRISESEAVSLWKGLKHRVHLPPKEHAGKLVLPKGRGPLLAAHRYYLERRGFNYADIAELWGVEGIGLAARLQWRLFIPIHDIDGTVVSWTTRSVSEKVKQRYLSASEDEEAVSHKSILYGAHLARSSVVIVEGPLDAWAIGPGAVATCGTAFSSDQVTAMKRYPQRIVCFDSEATAQRRAERLCTQLAEAAGTTELVLLETGSDAAAADPAEVLDLRRKYLEFT